MTGKNKKRQWGTEAAISLLIFVTKGI